MFYVFWIYFFGSIFYLIYVYYFITHRSRKTGKDIVRQKWRHCHPRVQRSLQWGICGIKILGRLYMRRRWAVYFRWLIRRDYRKTFGFFKRLGRRGSAYIHVRYFWCTIRHCIPCTRKSNKFRMGKGRGHKLIGWYVALNAGTIIVEYQHARYHYFKYITHLLRTIFMTRLQFIYRQRYLFKRCLTNRYTHVPYFWDQQRLSYHHLKHPVPAYMLRRYSYLID